VEAKNIHWRKLKLGLKEFLEDRRPVLEYNTFDKASEYWATFKGDSTDNLDPNEMVNASEGTDNPPMMIPTKHNIIAYFVEDKLPTSTVLDLGCGVGRMNLFYKIRQYWGIDTTPEMITKAIHLSAISKTSNQWVFKFFDGKEFPFQAGIFDYVFCSTVMLHLKIGTVRRYAEEVWRVLKDNGEFIVNFPLKSDLVLINKIFKKQGFKMKVLDSYYCGTDVVYSFMKPEQAKLLTIHAPLNDPIVLL
jgi:SAM-dependent methyltransferase